MQSLAKYFTIDRHLGILLKDGVEEEYANELASTLNKGVIKLIIFDLDQTLWEGVISEDIPKLPANNIRLIKSLVQAGIMCSIASFNSKDTVVPFLKANGLWESFIFPQITTTSPKSQMIAAILKKSNIQAQHTVFVDDEVRNRQEVKMVFKEMLACQPEAIFLLKPESLCNVGMERLMQYKLLENKVADMESNLGNGDNEEFLKKAQIEVDIFESKEVLLSCTSRIIELLQRTNQLNFTKCRHGEQEIVNLLENDKTYQSGLVRVKDKYGEYGLSGFYCVDKNSFELLHFVFSCRLLGMHVESAIYQFLKCPKLEIAPPVSTNIHTSDTSFVTIKKLEHLLLATVNNPSTETHEILLKGGCIFDSLKPLLETKGLKSKFNFMDNAGMHRKGHSFKLIQSATKVDFHSPRISELLQDDNIFCTNAKIVCLALWEDFGQTVFKIKEQPYYFISDADIDNLKNTLNDSEFLWLQQNSEKLGLITKEQFSDNLEKMYSLFNITQELVIMNFRAPMDSDSPEVHQRLLDFNRVIQHFALGKRNVTLFDISKWVWKLEHLVENSLFHFSKAVSISIAEELAGVFREKIK